MLEVGLPRSIGPYDWLSSDGLENSHSTTPTESLDCDKCMNGARCPSDPPPFEDDAASMVVSEKEVSDNDVPDMADKGRC